MVQFADRVSQLGKKSCITRTRGSRVLGPFLVRFGSGLGYIGLLRLGI